MVKLTKPQKLIYNMEKFSGGSISIICGSMLCSGIREVSKLQDAVNEIYRLNSALRMRIKSDGEEPCQEVTRFERREFEVHHFNDRSELRDYAEGYARKPILLEGRLCDIKIVMLPDKYGILIRMHHIIGDAWSLALIGTQFNEIMNGNIPEAFSYEEYAVAEEKYAFSKRCQKDREFFMGQFEKFPESTYLIEKITKTNKSKRKTFVMDRENTRKIKDYCDKMGVSVFTLFMAAFGVYYNRTHMNAERFYVGTAVLNRTNYREKNTVGMYVNTIPILIENDNEKSFRENFLLIQDKIMSSLRHQKYNYGDMLSDIRKKHGFSERLYDVVLSYQNARITGTEEAFESEWYHCGEQEESLQIHIDDRDNDGIFKIHYDYQVEKFGAYEIDMLHRHMETLLFDAISHDDKRIYELQLLTEEEQRKLLHDFNDTDADYTRDKCVHQLFEEQVRKTPDKVAVIACDKTLSYAELNEEANRIAHSLIEKGVGVGDIVAFALPRKSCLLTVMFGILKSGAAYMPIDPDYPQDRIDYMLADSEAKQFITENNLNEYTCDVGTNPNVKISPENYCYCIYTSGSTGNPKGTLLYHKGIINLTTNLKLYNNIEKIKIFGFLTTATFDVATQEILTALINGFTGVLFPNRGETDVDEIIRLIESNNTDIIYATPSYFDMMTYTPSRANKVANALKAVILAGESFYLNPYMQKLDNSLNILISNQYGPAETHVVSNAIGDVSSQTIGKPIANTQIYIVDKYVQPVPIGVTGELCIGGDGVGAGYLNRPELTAEKFIDNPFGEGKLYKTGDLAYWREDGNIVYVGRNDFQVKIRGLRIELGEIETAMLSVDGISQAVVIVRKNSDGRQLICAFYTGMETDAKKIRTQIGRKLPKYMLPHIFTHLDKLPLTTSGKVNRKALPDVDLYAVDTTVEYIAPETQREQALCSAIESVLKIEEVGLADNFFDLGGDSLKAIELISKLEKLGYQTDTKTIFDCNTVKELARQLQKAEENIEDFECPEEIPATPAQMRVYTAQSINAASTMYNVSYVFKAKEVDTDKLQQAIDMLQERHEILRTYFENKDGVIVQKVDEKATCHIEQLASDDIIAFVRPFDLSKAPLIRMGVYGNTIMLDMHHIITDGGSMSVFMKELNELYMGRMLDVKPIPYKHFAIMSHNYTESERYWLEVYKDEVPELTIKTDFKRGNKQSFNGSAIYDAIDIDLHAQIQEYCKKQGITPYVFYMAAFHILLSKFSGCEDIVVGMPISGREGKFLDTIGMFVNTVALRSKPKGTKTVADFLQEIKTNSINAIRYQDYPFGNLVKKLELNMVDRNPLFDVMFAYQSQQMTDIVFGDEKTELLPIPVTTSKYDFTFHIMPREKDVVIMAEYCTDLYKERTIHRFISGFKQLLVRMLSGGKLKDISAVLPLEQHKLLHDFNNTTADYPRDKCVHQLFEEQAEKTPEKIALEFGKRLFSFAELNGLANGLANQLKTFGICHGDTVAILSKRSYHIVVAMLAIFKCGGAYLPIDYNYPKDRIDTIVNDSECKAVLLYDVEYDSEKAFIVPEEITPIAENLKNISTPEDVCGIIYTSGSTGTPKGTLLKHRGLVNYSFANDALYVGCAYVLGFAIYTFDAFFLDTISPMLRGVTAVMATEGEQFSQSEFEILIKEHPDCSFFITPAKFKQFADNRIDPFFFKNIHHICIGGEVFPQEFIGMFDKNTKVYNVYGPTECSMWMMECPVLNENVTLGKPMANTKVYIVDSYLNPVPIGVTGELCIAGDGVGAGYLNRPELTAEKFMDNPFGEGKLYKTGDLAYWREDGNIVYVGRNDFQVKIRGLRIELGEIETAMLSVDGISQAVVIVRKNAEGRQLICAFYTGMETDAKEIRTQIGKKLPKYMLPHIFTYLDKLPLTTSGKVNRKALPDVDLYNIVNDTEWVAPVTEQQKELCKLMESVLKTSPVGITDDFFDLGGDSLKAIEFVSKAHSEGIYFNLQNIFDYPTVQALCHFIENGDKQIVSFHNEDFSMVNVILAKNTVEQMKMPEKTDVGNILLAGATGYLGIHILAEYLEHDRGIAYCIVRGNNQTDSEKRFLDLLRFYFGDKYVDSSRIRVCCGDLLDEHFKLSDSDYCDLLGQVDCVINCAASVKHYGSYKYFREANVETTKRLIDFCRKSGARLIHISTLSVSGNSFGDDFDGYISETEKNFYESNLYIEQPLDNVYGRSKFEAEKEVLDAMADGLQANIMRMGNLTNRLSDGIFQRNHESNAFLQRVKAVLELGLFPDYLIKDIFYAEFTPIDEAANAVMTIARHFSTEQTVFHINSIEVVHFDKLMGIFNQLGIHIKTVSGREFTEALRATAKQSGMEHIFETFINDMDENDQLNYDSNIRIENDFTVQYLKRLGFEWSDIGIEYLRKYVDYFKKIGYFEV